VTGNTLNPARFYASEGGQTMKAQNMPAKDIEAVRKPVMKGGSMAGYH
jgi:hypothetical protein